MYCPKCNCEYSGWNEKCPVCKAVLLEEKSDTVCVDSKPIEYAVLVQAVRENGGTLTIDISATAVVTKRGRAFPYIGRGYAWAKQFEGSYGDFNAKLTTTKVGRDRGFQFPYFGYGFAWEQEMQGSVNGNSLTLKADKVSRQRKMGFPYQGFGLAWVQALSGGCGDRLDATLTITQVAKRKKWSFPYFGFGFAWASAGQLTLTLLD